MSTRKEIIAPQSKLISPVSRIDDVASAKSIIQEFVTLSLSRVSLIVEKLCRVISGWQWYIQDDVTEESLRANKVREKNMRRVIITWRKQNEWRRARNGEAFSA